MIPPRTSIETLDILESEAAKKGAKDHELQLLRADHYQFIRQYYNEHKLPDNATQERRETYDLSMRMSAAANYRGTLQKMIDGWQTGEERK